jgi:hypothetical protein
LTIRRLSPPHGRAPLPIAVCWASGPKPYVQKTREGPAHHGLVSCPRPRGQISETSTWRWHGGSGSDSALRFGRAALQRHPHQQTFATTIKSSHSGRCCRLRSLSVFGKNLRESGRDRSSPTRDVGRWSDSRSHPDDWRRQSSPGSLIRRPTVAVEQRVYSSVRQQRLVTGFHRHVADLVEEQRAALGLLEACGCWRWRPPADINVSKYSDRPDKSGFPAASPEGNAPGAGSTSGWSHRPARANITLERVEVVLAVLNPFLVGLVGAEPVVDHADAGPVRTQPPLHFAKDHHQMASQLASEPGGAGNHGRAAVDPGHLVRFANSFVR